MSWSLRAFRAALSQLTKPILLRPNALAAVLVLVALTQGCAPPPPRLAGRDPSDPTVRVKAVDYRSTTAPYERQRPVEPAPWQEQNQRVTPAPKP